VDAIPLLDAHRFHQTAAAFSNVRQFVAIHPFSAN
jgi:hypothetical protein